MKTPLYRSFKYAFQGFWKALKTERNLKIHTAAALAAVGLGIYLRLCAVEWGLVVLAIGLVFSAELFNTALERVCDAAGGGKLSETIKNCKDIAAAAVIVAAIAALAIGIFILIVPFFQRVF